MSDQSGPETDELKKQGRVQAAPFHIKEAYASAAKYHLHSIPTVGGKFAVAVVHRGKLADIAVAGRPVARRLDRLDDGKTIEVLPVCTDGKPKCCSFLYARGPKIARLVGYTKVITYTLEEQSRATLRPVGGRVVCGVRVRERSAPSRRRNSQTVYGQKKLRWEL